MNKSTEIIDFKGIKAVKLCYGKYEATVANTLGSNVLRLYDNENNIDVFRYSDGMSLAEFLNAPEIWGLPTLYLPNRFDHGVLKTSDNIYFLPVNETKFKNHLHGFVHKRAHKIKEMGTTDNTSYLVTEFIFDENDYFYNVFPIKFSVEITFTLSENGLEHKVCLKNLSDNKMLPVSIATHTTYNAPFVVGAKQENIRLIVPAQKKLKFNKKRWLPTGKDRDLNDYDTEYKNGTKCPVLTDICNDMYISAVTELDGKKFRGSIMTDTVSGKKICNEIDENYKFWIVWNDEGFKNYFCVEPMTAQVNAPNLSMSAEKSGYREIESGESFVCKQRFFTM